MRVIGIIVLLFFTVSLSVLALDADDYLKTAQKFEVEGNHQEAAINYNEAGMAYARLSQVGLKLDERNLCMKAMTALLKAFKHWDAIGDHGKANHARAKR